MTETAPISNDKTDEERISDSLEKLGSIPYQQVEALEINSAYIDGKDVIDTLSTTENSRLQSLANNMRQVAIDRMQSLHTHHKENSFIQDSVEDIVFRADSQKQIADLTHGTSVAYDSNNDLYTALDYIYVSTSEWKSGQSLDEAKNATTHSFLKLAVQTEYSATDKQEVSSIFFVGTIGADEQEQIEMYVDIDGKWTVMDNLKQSQAARRLSEKMGYKDHVRANLDQLERKRQEHTLPLSDIEHDQFIDTLQDTYGNRYTQQEIEEIVQETLPSNVADTILEKEAVSEKKYRLISNVLVTQGTNAIFTGENPRDFSQWFSYDTNSGKMTRIFEEDIDMNQEAPDAWMIDAVVEKTT